VLCSSPVRLDVSHSNSQRRPHVHYRPAGLLLATIGLPIPTRPIDRHSAAQKSLRDDQPGTVGVMKLSIEYCAV
jgi:hypothetical protein